MASVKSNIILNGINTVSGFIFPVITFPYAARVLTPEGIGTINFLNSIIAYIVLFTSLGIPIYAVKEIARYRDDPAERDRITVEVILFSLGLCTLGYLAVVLLGLLIPQINAQSAIFYVLSLAILFNALGVNWFYQGIEDFKFITVRAIIFRTLSAVCLFVFVKDSSDLLIYAFIIVGSTVGNNIINFFHLRKFVSLRRVKHSSLRIMRHVRPTLEVFVLSMIVSVYMQLNLVMLGFLSSEEAVGYYTAGHKISHIGLMVVVSICTVIFPRCAHLIKSGQMEAFRAVINKSLDLILATSLPLMVGLLVLAVPITLIFCGEEYGPAIPVQYFTAPTIVFMSITNVLGMQVLYPMDKLRIVIWSAAAGAVCNLVLNFALIPDYGAVGAAVSTFFAELVVLIYQLAAGRRYYPFHLSSLFKGRYLTGSVLMGLCVYGITFWLSDRWLRIAIGVPAGMLVYVLYLCVVKDPVLREIGHFVRRKAVKT